MSARAVPSRARALPVSRRAQDGQAIVEFLVATMFFLLPLYLLIVALGKFADVQATTQQAARYAAWERTVWYADDAWRNRMGSTANAKSTAEIRSEIAQRILGENAPQLRSTDRSRGTLANGTMRMWTDPAGGALLQRYQDVALTETNRAFTLTQCETCVLPTAAPLPAPLNIGINVPQNNLTIDEVQLTVGRTSMPLMRLFPAYTGWRGVITDSKVALLPNEWAANGRDAVKTVVKDAVPTANNPLKSVLDASVKLPMTIFATEINGLTIGDIRPDEVPADRVR